jgi:hypothetical protein
MSEFKCPRCGDTNLCFHTVTTRKTPLSFENGKFEPAGRVEEIDKDYEKPPIRCGNGHALELMSDEGYVYTCDDMEYWLAEREQINEPMSWPA